MDKRDKTKYIVHYGTDRNAALQPEYIPVEHERQRSKNKPRVNLRKQRRAQVARYTGIIMLTVVVAAMGCVVINRNAKIYENNSQIRKLSAQQTQAELLVKTAQMQAADDGNIEEYINYAKDNLNLDYPAATQMLSAAACPENDNTEDKAENTQVSFNLFDMILDWWNSLERRI